MLRNYFTIAFRSLLRNKGYSFINIAGLGVGMAACLLLFMIIRYHQSVDDFHVNKERIYRVVYAYKGADGLSYTASVPFPLADALRQEDVKLEKVAPIYGDYGEVVIVPGDNGTVLKKMREKRGVFFTSPSFFETFDFKLLAGSVATLAEPNTTLLTQEAAETYFGDWRSAMGKTLLINNHIPLKVTGILSNIPTQTDFPLKVVPSFETLLHAKMKFIADFKSWESSNAQSNCYVLVPPGYSEKQLNGVLANLAHKYMAKDQGEFSIFAQPLHSVHFDSRFQNYRGQTFSWDLLTALGLIGLFLLVVACVNFINLATAQAMNRAKEVGVRKVMGSNRWQLVGQFLNETFFITFFALLLSIVIADLALPMLNKLLGLQVPFILFSDPVAVVFMVVVLGVVTVLSGVYPAVVLSGFNPITALKNKMTVRTVGGLSLRRGLVIFQFVVAQALIIGVLVVVSQMNYFRSADLGFNKTAILNVEVPTDSSGLTKVGWLRLQLAQLPGVQAFSFGFAAPADYVRWYEDFRYDNSPKPAPFSASIKWSDTAFFRLFNLSLVAGRIYFASDTTREFVVNETLVHALGVHHVADALGKMIVFKDGSTKGVIVGVVKDFHSVSLRDPIEPVIIAQNKYVYRSVCLQIDPSKSKALIGNLQQLWDKAFPDAVFDYSFLGEKLNGFYKQEDQLAQLYKIFAVLAVFISCLGLYGLVSFMAVQRNKEIGIRKVLGASVVNIVYLLSKEFTVLIAVAFLIAAPLAYYFMHRWLANFTFRIELGVGIFVATLVVAMVLAWLTVGYRAIRVALVSPVKSLKSE